MITPQLGTKSRSKGFSIFKLKIRRAIKFTIIKTPKAIVSWVLISLQRLQPLAISTHFH